MRHVPLCERLNFADALSLSELADPRQLLAIRALARNLGRDADEVMGPNPLTKSRAGRIIADLQQEISPVRAEVRQRVAERGERKLDRARILAEAEASERVAARLRAEAQAWESQAEGLRALLAGEEASNVQQ
jgi:hypothetical protein